MKYPHHQDYDGYQTDLCERALLTIWPHLGNFHSSLALVGGLAPRYLCHKPEMETRTIDVDLGISIASGEGSYQGLSFLLRAADFRLKDNRYIKNIEGYELALDFLTEANNNAGAAMTVEDIRANAFIGVERAVQVVREVTIQGTDLLGATVSETVRVCEAGPYLCLKLVAYGQRAMKKDLFDIIQVVQSYDRGPAAAAGLFRAEATTNPAYPRALQVLHERFTDIKGKAAIHYADFCVGARSGTIPPADFRLLWEQRANTAVTAGILLLEAESEGTLPVTKITSPIGSRRGIPDVKEHGSFEDEFFRVRREAKPKDQSFERIAGEDKLELLLFLAGAIQ